MKDLKIDNLNVNYLYNPEMGSFIIIFFFFILMILNNNNNLIIIIIILFFIYLFIYFYCDLISATYLSILIHWIN